MLVSKEQPQIIAAEVNASISQVYRYRRQYLLTGDPFVQSRSSQNSLVLAPWAMEVCTYIKLGPGIHEALLTNTYQKVFDLLKDKPWLYLDEIQQFLVWECQLYVHPSTISRHLASEEWTKKKLHHRAQQRSEPLRIDWLRKISLFTAEMLVFCDESGTDRSDGQRRTGWAPKGLPAWRYTMLSRGKRLQILPALCVDGLLDLMVYKGNTNGDAFAAWLQKGLLPRMNRFPARNSILVMDNASIHHDSRVQALCWEAGVLLWYLPPYSPDFNPIEAFFKDLKAYIRRHYQHDGGDDLNQEEFEKFVETAAWKVAEGTQAIQGHFRTAYTLFREEGGNTQYADIYAAELDEYMRTSTVG
jgi:transposase